MGVKPKLVVTGPESARSVTKGLEAVKQRGGMEPDDLLCSRNARSRTPLVGRAQWKINQPPSLERNEQAWREYLKMNAFNYYGPLGVLGF